MLWGKQTGYPEEFLAMTEPRLNAEQQRPLTMLATAGPNSAAQALLSAHGFDPSNQGLATLMAEKVLAGEKLIVSGKARIM